jgi:hypothetical protein
LTGLATFRVVGNPGIIVTPQGSHDHDVSPGVHYVGFLLELVE